MTSIYSQLQCICQASALHISFNCISILKAVLGGDDFSPMGIMNRALEKYEIIKPVVSLGNIAKQDDNYEYEELDVGFEPMSKFVRGKSRSKQKSKSREKIRL